MAALSEKQIKIQLQNLINLVDPWLAYQRWINEVPSFAVGAVYKNKIVFSKGYGFADLERKVKATPKTVYRIASNSKLFTAIGIMRLEQAGLLRLGDRVSKYLPWFASKRESALASLTIQELLTNTSGLIREGHTTQWSDDKFVTPRQLQDFVAKGLFSKSPRGKFKYSNLGFAVLGLLLEKVSGKTYAEYMREIITKPLGLQLTDARLLPKLRKNLARGYGMKFPDAPKRKIFIDPETYAMEAATGFSSNVEDLLKFLQVQFYGNEKIVSDRIKKRMYAKLIRTAPDKKGWTGLGYEIWEAGKRTMVGHGGGFAGFRTFTALDPKAKFGIVFLSNAMGVAPRFYADEIVRIFDYFLKNSNIFSSKPNPRLRKYAGFYRSRWGDLLVAVAGNRLLAVSPRIAPSRDFTVLEPAGKDRFLIHGHGLDSAGEFVEFEFSGKRKILKYNRSPHQSIELDL